MCKGVNLEICDDGVQLEPVRSVSCKNPNNELIFTISSVFTPTYYTYEIFIQSTGKTITQTTEINCDPWPEDMC